MKFRSFIALFICAALPTSSVAQTRMAVGAVSGINGISVVPTLGLPATGTPSLNSSFLSPSISAVLSVIPSPSLSVSVIPAAAQPLLVPVAAAKAVQAPASALASARSVAPVPQGSPSVSAVQIRSQSENFWSGAASKEALSDESSPVVVPAAKSPSLLRGVGALAPASAAVALPHWTSAVTPYAEGAALIGGAYALNRVVRWALEKTAAKRGWERNTVAMSRFVSSLVVWGGAAALGLSMAGVSGSALAETFGLGGTAMALAISLAVKDVAGNLFHGVHFLLTRPFTIGDKVTIGKTTAVVRDLTLRYVVLTGEDGRDVLRTHASLAAVPVTLYGTYQTKEARLKFRRPVLPRGLLRAVRDAATPALWKPVVFSAAGIAALALFPMLGGFAATKSLTWIAALLPYVKAGLVAFLASSVSSTLARSIGRLGERYAWNPAVVTVAKLGASVLTWVVGGSFLLNAVGVSWPWVLKTLSLGGALVSIAVVDYGTSIFNAIVTFKLKPFEIGQANVTIGEHTGTVVDITWQNVVLKLDDSSYIIIPHSVVKDAEIKNPHKYGQRAEP